MKVLLVLPLLAACAHAGAGRPVSDLSTQYEVAMITPDVDAPLPPEYSGTVPPCVASTAAPVSGSACVEAEVSPDESAAFHSEATRLAGHGEENCRKLGDAIQNNLSAVRMYDRAIVRRSGPYRFYGVGHSYQRSGEWMIRIARRLDELNERTIDAKARTLRHEVSHTLGAKERRVGEEWAAADYAERCS
ncbi:MAG: hypothetical protein M3O61_15310 [Gemmatimonadota bacterium]|nr:hypothetical protein [Gemmatimonadota bacterium]